MKEFIDSFNITNYIYSIEELESFSTEKLVGFIHHNQIYRHDSYGESPIALDNWKNGEYIEVDADWNDNCIKAYYWANEQELRNILKTRPNIPNKIQRKNRLKDIISKNRKHVKKNLKYSR